MLISDFLMHRQTQRAPLAGARNAQNAKLKKCTKCKAREMQIHTDMASLIACKKNSGAEN